MEKRTFGSTGVQLPVIGQGTWMMEETPAKSVKALQKGLTLGMTHIDTAEMYGSGEVEKLVAKAIDGQRKKIFLTSKVLPTNASYEGTLQACEKSLKRLKTDYLDLYLLHWPGDHPLEETFRAFEALKKEGKIRRYGVSNFDVKDMEEAISLVGAKNIACNQVFYHLKERSIEFSVLPWCKKKEVAIAAYSPFGQGDFPTAKSPGGKILQEIADKHNANPRQVALQFILREPNVFAIPKTSNPDHVEENAKTDGVKLSPNEIEKIDMAFPAKQKRRLAVI